jgi:hypothetical protein
MTKKNNATTFGDHMESRLKTTLEAVLASAEWRSMADPDAEARFVIAATKYLLLEVFSYGPHVTEATFTAISRLPKDRPDLMKPMIMHDLEEVDHGEMALKDFLKLGGDEGWARARRISPESYAMAGTVRLLAEREHPAAYLGYMYLFEGLTPILTAKAQELLAAKGFPAEACGFIDFHATEDIAHVKVLKALIERVVRDYPEAGPAIEYGYDCFEVVYPLPIWRAAIRQARTEIGARSESVA